MSTGLISWDTYFPEGFPEGFGSEGNQLYSETYKALEATPGLPRVGPGINALGVEDLSPVLASAEIQMEQLTFWNKMPKEEAYSLDVEASRLDTFGEDGMDGFIGGNDAGIVTDPRFTRITKQVKYIAVKGQVTLPTQSADFVGFRGRGKTAMDTSETIKMQELLRQTERNLWWGDTLVSPLHFDGAFRQIDDSATVSNRIRLDLRGNVADKDLMATLAEIGASNNCNLTDLYFPNEGLRDLQQSMFPQQRMGENVRTGEYGADFNAFLIQTIGGNPGRMTVNRNHMLTLGVGGGIPRFVPTVAGQNAPAPPTSVGVAAGAWTATAFRPGLDPATYTYSVVAVSKGGWSLGTSSNAQVTSGVQAITLSINHADNNVLYYYVFRNPSTISGTPVSNRFYIARVPRTGSITNWVDDGYSIPNTYHVCCLTMSMKEILFKQLLPVVKRPLPQDLMANSYGILLFGTPLFKVPTHNIHVVNVGQRGQPGVPSTN